MLVCVGWTHWLWPLVTAAASTSTSAGVDEGLLYLWIECLCVYVRVFMYVCMYVCVWLQTGLLAMRTVV